MTIRLLFRETFSPFLFFSFSLCDQFWLDWADDEEPITQRKRGKETRRTATALLVRVIGGIRRHLLLLQCAPFFFFSFPLYDQFFGHTARDEERIT